jgi:two-component system, OmpR family, copper resistance phosphate regulon response regulator CusR
MNEAKRILIVEDDLRIAQNISRGLEEKGYKTEIAYDGQIGLKLGLTNNYDLILLDLNLPALNGYEVCQQIRARNAQIPIIMLTALGETEDKIEGFEHGADDYIVKPFDLRELVARIQVFLKRRSSGTEETVNILTVADLEMNLDSKLVTRQGTAIELTPKEFSLLEYLIRNKNKIVSKDEIAHKIWDNNANQSLNVIEVYINFLRKKIDKDFTTRLIYTKTGMGYILKED